MLASSSFKMVLEVERWALSANVFWAAASGRNGAGIGLRRTTFLDAVNLEVLNSQLTYSAGEFECEFRGAV
jgi:hypothetical protein